jgi:ribosomal-protein-alanine N-acetyltransferase
MTQAIDMRRAMYEARWYSLPPGGHVRLHYYRRVMASVPGKPLVDRDNADVRIRTARLDDLPRVHTLDADVFGALAYQPFVLRQLFDLHAPGWVVADIGGDLVGYSLIAPDFDRHTAWLLALGVRADCRGERIGERLLQQSLRSLVRVEVTRLSLTVSPNNHPAIALYEKAGFTVTERQQDYLGPGEDRLLMELGLHS